MAMRLGPLGYNLLKAFEGCKLNAYEDLGGVWTIGYGHTGTDVREGMTISPYRADELLRKDVERFESAVNRLVKVAVTQRQFDALVCFAFNIGDGALAKSTLLRRLNEGNFAAAADQFLRWDKVDGVSVAGLARRRRAEWGLFMKDVA